MGLLRQCVDLVEPSGRKRWLLLLAVALASSAFEAGGAVLTVLILQAVNSGGRIEGLPLLGDVDRGREMYVFLGFCALFFVLRGVTVVVQAYLQHRIAGNAGVRLSERLHRAYLDMPYDLYVRRNSSELIRNAQNSVEGIVRYIFIPGVMLFADAGLVIAITVVLLVAQPVATLTAAAALVLVVLPVQRIVRPRLLVLGQVSEQTSQAALQSLQQSLQGVREVKLSGSHEQFQRDYIRQRRRFTRAYYLQSTLEAAPRVTVETAFVLLVLAFLVAAVARGSELSGAVSVLGLFAYAVLRVLPAVNRMLSAVNNMKYGTASVANVRADLEAARAWTSTDVPQPVRRGIAIREQIAFEDVSYRYPGTDRLVVDGASFSVRRGESIGVVGPTGGGKSTLIDLLLGLLTPTAGAVRVDGRDVRTDLPAWHASVGVVSQTVFLLDDTLRRNIAFGVADEDVSEERVLEVVGLAQLDHLVAGLPDGLDTFLGERGARLSGGQRQRVAIARALYRSPDLLVMDEGTSALDNLTEAEIVRALAQLRGQMTLVTVAHRLTTVRECDRILLVEAGRILDFAPYDELVARHDVFRRMAT